jgi:hypothetical protein
MTVAACEALALRQALRLGKRGDRKLARNFFREAARAIDIPWQLAVGSDLALPCVKGERPLSVRVINAYIARLRRAAVHDAEVAIAFQKVVHLLARPPSLFAPGIVWRVMRHGGAVGHTAAGGSGSRLGQAAPGQPV